jgi:hypothetical protein
VLEVRSERAVRCNNSAQRGRASGAPLNISARMVV